jgi:hypothetical protein
MGFCALVVLTFFVPPRYAESPKNKIRISPEEYCGILFPSLNIWDSFDSEKNLDQQKSYKNCLNKRPIDSFLLLVDAFVIFISTFFLFLIAQNLQIALTLKSQKT